MASRRPVRRLLKGPESGGAVKVWRAFSQAARNSGDFGDEAEAIGPRPRAEMDEDVRRVRVDARGGSTRSGPTSGRVSAAA